MPRRPLSSWAAFVVLYRTLLRSVRTTARLACLSVFGLLTVALAALAASSDGGTSLGRGLDQASAGLSQAVALGALVLASAVLGELYDNGSIVYLALRPVSSRVLAAAGWAAAATWCLPLGLVAAGSVVAVHSGDGLAGASLLAAVLAVAAYVALFGFLGVLVKRALPVGLAFLVLWEGVVAQVGKAGSALTVTGYLRSLLARLTDHPLEHAELSLATAVVGPIAATVLFVLLTARVLDRRELP